MNNVQEIRVRNDGEEVEIVFGGDASHTITLSVADAISLEQKLLESVIAARATTAAISDSPKEFETLPEIILVGRIEAQVMSDGSLNFLIQTRDGRTVQLSFHDKHVVFLREMFSQMETGPQ